MYYWYLHTIDNRLVQVHTTDDFQSYADDGRRKPRLVAGAGHMVDLVTDWHQF
jgi:hypothetical protein